MAESVKDKRIARRELFKMAGLGSIAGAAMVVGAGRDAKADAKDDAQGGAGYRETEHVKTYYKLAAF